MKLKNKREKKIAKTNFKRLPYNTKILQLEIILLRPKSFIIQVISAF